MIKYEIEGGSLPVLICYPEVGETLCTQSGAMSWMSPNMQMTTNSGGGIKKALGRLLSGAPIQFLILLCNTDELTLHDGNVALLAGQFLTDDSLLQLHFLNQFPLLVLVGFQRITGLLLLSLQPLLSDDLYEHGTLLLLSYLPVQRVHITLKTTGF